MGHIPGEVMKTGKLHLAGRNPHSNAIIKKQKGILQRANFCWRREHPPPADLVDGSETTGPHLMQRHVLEVPF